MVNKKETSEGKKKVGKKKGKKVCEIFKDKKDKTIQSCGVMNVGDKIAKGQINKENKILFWVFLISGIVIMGFVLGYFVSESTKRFDYRGLDFEQIQQGKVTFYHTVIPIYSQGEYGKQVLNYNIYLRNNPFELEKINFEGNMKIMEMAVLKTESDFNCEGDGGIAGYNMKQILSAFEISLIQDPNATCDEQGRYTSINILDGDKSRIEQYGSSCYNLYVNNCEILEVTEKFLVEALVEHQN